MRNTLRDKPDDWSKDQEIAARFDEELKDIHTEGFDHIVEMEHDPAVFKYDFLEFMSKEDIKKLPKSKHP